MNHSTPKVTKKKAYTAEEIQAWLVSQIAEHTKINAEEIDVHEPLESYGLDSSQLMIIANKAEKLLGFKLSIILLWHYPTIEALSKRLAEEFTESKLEVLEI